MSSISTSLSLKDRFTSTLNKGVNSVDRMLKKMNSIDKMSDGVDMSRPFKSVPAKVDSGTKRVENFTKKTKEAVNAANQVKSSWGGVGSVIKTAIAAFGAKKIIDITDDMTSAKARLKLMNDGNQSDADLQAKIMESAQRSRAGYLDTASAIAKLGLNARSAFARNDETIAFMEQVNKLFVIGGASAQEQSNAMTQLTQAMAAGALRGEELNSILDAGPGIARAIEKYMGISEGSIKSVAEQGLVTADVVKNALFSAAKDTNEMFESMPKTYGQVWTQIKNKAISAFDGIMTRINGFLNSDTGTAIVNGILNGINIVASGVSWLMDRIESMGNTIKNNWSKIQPIIEVAAPISIGIILALFAAWTVSAASAAIATLAAVWPLLLIGAAIGLSISLAMKMGATFGDVCEFIGAILGGLYALGYNLIADAWNLIAVFIEFFGNVFNDPIGSIIRLFYDLLDVVLGVVETIANALDAVFGSNMAAAVNGFRDDMKSWVDDSLGEKAFTVERMDKLDYGNTVNSWAAGGKAFGNSVEDAMKSFDGALSSISDPFGGIDSFDMAESMSGANLGKVDEVGKINSDVNIADEDIKLLKDVAEMRYVQNFVTLQPSIAMSASVTKDADFDTFYNQFGERITEEAYATAEGYYG